VDSLEVSKCIFLGIALSLQIHSMSIAGNPDAKIMLIRLSHATHPEIHAVNRLLLNQDQLVEMEGNLSTTDDLETLKSRDHER
jgi:hypothetical protein